ncbi:MAG: VCBS repeat-containing protein [Flavobacteriales bacterium]|nr:VCBS repeat-containing protein [Flavobacteriales bacterium]
MDLLSKAPAFLFLSAVLSSGPIQAQFGSGVQLYPFGGSARMQGVDLDGDGDEDLFGVFNGHHLKWFENQDGLGSMSAARPISTVNGDVELFQLADADGDGDVDILIVRDGQEAVHVLRNDGSELFGPLELVLNTPQEPAAMVVRDLNGDGNLDLVLTLGTTGSAGFGWCPGSPNGFGGLVEVLELHGGPRSSLLEIGDIDLVGGVDIVLLAENDELILVRNTAGDATVWEPASLPIAAEPPSYPYRSPILIDVDNDGDLDLAESRSPSVHWLRNDLDEGGELDFSENLVEPWTTGGTGVFGASPCGGAGVVYVPSDPDLPVRWNTYVDLLEGFPYSNDQPDLPRGQDLRLADLNGDDRLDLIMVLPNGVKWFPSTAGPSPETLELPVLDTLCLSGMAVELPDALPANGRWYGEQVFGSLLMRGNILEPTHLPLVHVVHTPEGCPLAGSSNMRLIDRPTILTAIPDLICSGDSPIPLLSDPVDVQWYGTDGSDTLDPAVFSGGYVVCEYTDPTGSVCGNLRGPILRWNTLPATITPAGPFCTGDPLQTITASAIPPFGGVWSGDITGSTPQEATFDPSQGPGEFQIVLNVLPFGQNQCANSDTLRITVGERPTITFTPFAAYCATGEPITLDGVSPLGGVWSGPGVIDGTLDRTVAGPGTHLLSYYAASPEGCARQSAVPIVLTDTVVLAWDAQDLELCPLDGPVNFSATPVGGAWSAPIDASGTCDPSDLAPGSFPVTYTYTDPQGCVLMNEELDIQMGRASEVFIDPVGTLCSVGEPVLITGSQSGTWSGAVTGEGSSILFDPSILGPGTWAVTLTATVGADCPGSSTQEIVVEVCSGIVDRARTSVDIAPNPFSDHTWITMDHEGTVQIDVLDPAGRAVCSDIVATPGPTRHLVDLLGRSAGTYLIRTRQGHVVRVFRAVKLN